MQVKYEIGIAHTDYELINPQNNVQILNNNHAFYGASISRELNYNFHLRRDDKIYAISKVVNSYKKLRVTKRIKSTLLYPCSWFPIEPQITKKY